MTVTKQQQLEWLVKHIGDWCGNRPSAYLMSCNEIGFIIGLATQVTPKELLCGGYHIITQQEWQQERDKMSSKPEVDNSWHGRGEFPPVGCECYIRHSCWNSEKYEKVTVAAITSEYVIVKYATFEQHYMLKDISFLPLRTEREKAIDEMVSVILDYDGYMITSATAELVARQLHDSGYRKVKQ